MKKIDFKKSTLIVFVTLLIVAGFFYFKNKSYFESGDVSDWKKYKSEEYGFTFKAPEKWRVDKGKDDRIGLILLYDENAKEQLSISVIQNKEGQEEFKGLCHDQNSETCDKSKEGVIDFKAGTGFVYNDSIRKDSKGKRFIILANKRLTFSFNNSKKSDFKKVNQIINSIEVDSERREVDEFSKIKDLFDGEYKFSETTLDDWKEYSNETFKVKTKIPEGWSCGEVSNTKFESQEGRVQSLVCMETQYLSDHIRQAEQRKFDKKQDYPGLSLYIRPVFRESLMRGYAPMDPKRLHGIMFHSSERMKFKVVDLGVNRGVVSWYSDESRFFYMDRQDKYIEILYTDVGSDSSEVFDGFLKSFEFLN